MSHNGLRSGSRMSRSDENQPGFPSGPSSNNQPDQAIELSEALPPPGPERERVVMLGRFVDSIPLPSSTPGFAEVRPRPNDPWLIAPPNMNTIATELLSSLTFREAVTNRASGASTPRGLRLPFVTAPDGVLRELEFGQLSSDELISNLKRVGSPDSLFAEAGSRNASTSSLAQLQEQVKCGCSCVVGRAVRAQHTSDKGREQSGS